MFLHCFIVVHIKFLFPDSSLMNQTKTQLFFMPVVDAIHCHQSIYKNSFL